jgi:hypothetical protein
MSTSELKDFLKAHEVFSDDILDKETLCRRVWETYCESMSITELEDFFLQNPISMVGCTNATSPWQTAKNAFCPPTRPAPPPASVDTSQVRWRKDDKVVLTGSLNRADLNGAEGTLVSVDDGFPFGANVSAGDVDRLLRVKLENLRPFLSGEEHQGKYTPIF